MTNDDSAPTRLKSSAKQFSCPSCGGLIQIHALGQSLSASCVHCQSIIDVSNSTLKILQEFKDSAAKIDSEIKLNSVGNFHNTNWRCIGILLQTDSTGYWSWHEHLLFSPEKGFRWLVENRGHWTLFKKTKYTPKKTSGGVHVYAKDYQHYTSDSSKVECALGEFNWRVKVGERAAIRDYINPPEMVSESTTANDVNWQIGEYLTPDQVKIAFALEKDLPRPRGIAPNQPSPHRQRLMSIWKHAALLLVLLTVFQIGFACAAKESSILIESYDANTEKAKAGDVVSFVSQPFTLRGGEGSLEIKSQAPVANNWVDVGLTLVNTDTQQAFQLEQQISYYYGYSHGESWKEGADSVSTLLPAVPDGTYILNIDARNLKSQQPARLNVEVNRDVFFMSNFWLALCILFVFPIWSVVMHRSFETLRWEDSDHGSTNE